MKIEQTLTAKKLVISNTAFRRIAKNAHLEFEWGEALKVIKLGKQG